MQHQENYGKKKDTFHLGWGAEEKNHPSKTHHPNKPRDNFSLGWGQNHASEMPRNRFNPHQVNPNQPQTLVNPHQAQNQGPSHAQEQRELNKQRQQRGNNFMSWEVPQKKQEPVQGYQPMFQNDPNPSQYAQQPYDNSYDYQQPNMPNQNYQDYQPQLNGQHQAPIDQSNQPHYDTNHYDNHYAPSYPAQDKKNELQISPEQYAQYIREQDMNQQQEQQPQYGGEPEKAQQNGAPDYQMDDQEYLRMKAAYEQQLREEEELRKQQEAQNQYAQQVKALEQSQNYQPSPAYQDQPAYQQQPSYQDQPAYQQQVYQQQLQNGSGYMHQEPVQEKPQMVELPNLQQSRKNYGYPMRADNDIFNRAQQHYQPAPQRVQKTQQRSGLFFGDHENSYRSSYQDMYKK